MNRRSTILPRAFTLVEVLIAVAILAVLVVVGFMVSRSTGTICKKTPAQFSIQAIESAVNQFHAEYGILPVPGRAGDAVVRSDDPSLLEALLGREKGPGILNTRGIKFLSAKEGKIEDPKGRDGLVYEPDGKVRGLYDPWGGAYFIRFDGDHDGKIDGVKTDAAATATTLSGKICAVWTNGRDGVERGSGKTADDVTSWQP